MLWGRGLGVTKLRGGGPLASSPSLWTSEKDSSGQVEETRKRSRHWLTRNGDRGKSFPFGKQDSPRERKKPQSKRINVESLNDNLLLNSYSIRGTTAILSQGHPWERRPGKKLLVFQLEMQIFPKLQQLVSQNVQSYLTRKKSDL